METILASACNYLSNQYAMKILDLHKTITTDQLLMLLQQKLNPLFHQQKQSDISFTIENNAGAVEISQPEIYEGFLFRIEIVSTTVHITRSGHYIDDVNSLTLETILNSLFEELAKDGKVTLVLEG
ncbi:hypothetical protein [Mucilaginibacter sp.]|uniref:hypothetical protein n=1 Tax=Mucilaginibacter sp. TaxID=1882438 RepID=UPI002611AB25|nr:hypothetical protein [Mucilaginibacter sp.]MDB4920791.1 hypothetical protein [Mucilaginibacter sp.]